MSFGIPVRNGLGVGLLASTYLSSRRAAYPAMSLDFLQPFLDSRITFSRGSNATLVDATGKITYAPANLITYSQELDNAAWTKQGLGVAVAPTVTANAGLAPDGTMTADRVQFSLNGGTTLSDSSQIVQGVTFADATYIFSVWLKSNTGSSQTVILLNVNSGGPAETVTTEWTRFTRLVSTAASASNAGVRIRGTVTGGTADVLMWGAQLEPVTYQTTPSTYVATTASAYYGPRFDYDPVTLAPKGLLIEEARTNSVLYSEQFDDVAWVKSTTTITANATTSPDGAVDADKLVENSASLSQFSVRQTYASFVAASYTFTFYAKAAERIWTYFEVGNTYANVNLSTGAVGATGQFSTGWTFGSASATAVGNGWYRCSITSTCTTPGSYFGGKIHTANADNSIAYAGTIGSGLFIWGAQLEAGSFATSYIPTVASTVTRSADVATMTGTNFSSWYNQSEGTFVMNFTPDEGLVNNQNRVLSTTSGGVSNRVVDVSFLGTNWVNYNGTNTTAIGAASVTTIPQRIAVAYATANYGYTLNGGTVTTDSAALVNSPTQLSFGRLDTSGYLNGHIRQIAYYNTRLPNAQLQTLTAPSLATTLSLSFTNQAYTVGV